MSSPPITFPGAGGARLAGRLEQPLNGAPRAWALFAHCFTCSKDLRAAVRISRELARAGFGVLRFDFTGLGESAGDFAATTFSSNVGDLAAAAAYLEREHGAPQLLVGHSLGGAAVLRAALDLPSVRAVATIGAPHDPAHVTHLFAERRAEIAARGEAEVTIAGRRFRVRQEFLDDVAAARTDETLARLGRPLLLLHSPVDQIVGVEHAARLFHAARHPKSYVSLDAADHLLTAEADQRYAAGVIAAWAAKYLDPAAAEPREALPASNGLVARTGAASYRTDMRVRGHALVADEPASVGGGDEGPTPYDYLTAALGACTGMTLRMYADRKGWPLEEVSVHLTHAKVHAEDCAECEHRTGRLDVINRTIALRGDLDETQRARLMEIADRCPVHRTLSERVVVVTRAAV